MLLCVQQEQYQQEQRKKMLIFEQSFIDDYFVQDFRTFFY